MALLFMDSFDHYATADILEKWSTNTNGTISASNGRHSSASCRYTSSGTLTKGLATSGSTAVVGVACKFSTVAPSTPPKFIIIYDAAITKDQVYIQLNPDGSISAFRGSTSAAAPPVNAAGTSLGAASAPGVITAGVFHYVELKAVLNDTTGSITVKVNGSTVLSLTSVDTANTSVAWTNVCLVAHPTMTTDYDDIYICDGSGSAPYNDFLGDCRVDSCYPTAEGTTIGWTPLSGTDNALMIDETAPDDDTTYNSAASTALTDTLIVQDAPVVGATIYGIQHNISMKKSDAGICTLAPVIRHSGVNNSGTTFSPGTGYAYNTQVATEIAPGVAITESNFNAAEFGYTRLT